MSCTSSLLLWNPNINWLYFRKFERKSGKLLNLNQIFFNGINFLSEVITKIKTVQFYGCWQTRLRQKYFPRLSFHEWITDWRTNLKPLVFIFELVQSDLIIWFIKEKQSSAYFSVYFLNLLILNCYQVADYLITSLTLRRLMSTIMVVPHR